MNELWLGVTKIKDYMKLFLSPYFKEQGFQYKRNIQGNVGFVQKDVVDFFMIFFNVYTLGDVLVSSVFGYIDKVERILFNIQLPNMSYKYYYAKAYSPLNQATIVSLRPTGQFRSKTLYTSQDLQDFCNDIINYFEKEGEVFIDQFDSLQKVYNHLKRSDNIDLYPLRSWPDKPFKATIIYKLMEDDGYEDYKKSNEEKILSEYKRPDEWLAAYHNLCALLEDEEFMKDYLL